MDLVNHTLETPSAICWLWGQFSLLRGTCLIYSDISPVLNGRNYLNMTILRSWSVRLKEAKDSEGCLTGEMRIEQRISETAVSLVCWGFFCSLFTLQFSDFTANLWLNSDEIQNICILILWYANAWQKCHTQGTEVYQLQSLYDVQTTLILSHVLFYVDSETPHQMIAT